MEMQIADYLYVAGRQWTAAVRRAAAVLRRLK
jgi:outer membrane protein assembly factor BamD (BamD/ComL family)